MGRLEPIDGVPDQPDRSIRRITSLHAYRSHATAGQVVIDGRARDSLLGGSGGPPSNTDVRVRVYVDYEADRAVTAVSSVPDEPRLEALVAHPVTSGFRNRLYEAMPACRGDGSLTMAVLEDVPNVGSLAHVVFLLDGQPELSRGVGPPPVDICAGYRRDTEYGRAAMAGVMAPLPERAPVPKLSADIGPALSDGAVQEGGQFRRIRRLDLTTAAGGSGSELLIDAWFRDSIWRPPGGESAVHEYSIRARVEASSLEVTSCEATPHVLPTWECEGAVASARRLVGRTLGQLRDEVRREFRGVATCTHLNEEMRSLGDAHALASQLAGVIN